ncbi:MAG TPA: alkaline phosphatase family protein [Isosphaeraceae bacterium]|nr:alkaline phosphatase family protein [Isosphaeraceae bacterium]
MKRLWISQVAAMVGAACLTLTYATTRQALAQDAPHYAGPTDKGFLLPNGWKLQPAGEQVPQSDLPLNIVAMADNRHALVATSGYNSHDLSLVDLDQKRVANRQTVRESWFGLAVSPEGDRVWWSGGGGSKVHAFRLADQRLANENGPEPETKDRTRVPKGQGHFGGGIALDRNRKRLYSLDVDRGTLAALDLVDRKEVKSVPAGTRPYDVALARNGLQLYVSDWAGRTVRVLDAGDLRTVAKVAVGEHPNQIAVHPHDDRVFVACASSDSVSVIDATRGIVIETIHTALFPRSPEGSTPDALAIAPDGKTLFVANADNNNVAVIDIAAPSRSQVKGFIPTGWYPTAVAVTPDGKRLLIGVGKGLQTKSNAIPPPLLGDAKAGSEAKARGEMTREKTDRDPRHPHVGATLSGSLSIVTVPDDKTLAEYTETVYKNCPYSDKMLTDSPYPAQTAIPTKVGNPSPIKHVLYIIKENRTYDQVFGDMPRGNGDSSLVMFGREVTPNHHKLAEQFVLLDNLYCNGHVSADGHPWSTMAYGTDYIARNWALTYSRRAGIDDDDDGDLSNAPSGYLWDLCARNGRSYRNYGEYGRRVSQPDGSIKMEAAVPGLVGHMSPDYGISKVPGKRARDTDNADTFLREFREFEQNGNLPQLMIMSLGEDHTTGTRPGTFTPRACVASNDLALGRIVDAITKSKYWPETAIFVIEDDAQNGPDHVDAHRTIGLVISPFTRRNYLDSTQYSTVSMIRTFELILGLPPLSQYDAAARPMFDSFTDKADLATFTHEPPRIDLNEINEVTAYGADRSLKMDFDEYDKIDDFELNEILWRSIKGKDAPLPPAVRRAVAYRGGR